MRLMSGLAASTALLAACETVPSAVPITEFRCGERTVAVSGQGETLRMTSGGRTWDMTRTISASGARYAAQRDPDTVFWNRGNEATVTIAGEQYPICYSVDTTTADQRMRQLTGAEWVVEDINGAGVVDNSRATLNFSSSGAISGRGSCNSYTGRFQLTGTGIVIHENIAATMMACAPALMEQERRFFDALSATKSFEIAPDGALVLNGLAGKLITARR